jgi:hypothetical protein
MIVYHNRWLDMQEKEKLERVYMSGGVAAYAFYAFQGVKECQTILFQYFFDMCHLIFDQCKKIIKDFAFSEISKIFLNIYFFAQGFFIAFIFAKILPIPEKENVVKRFYNK